MTARKKAKSKEVVVDNQSIGFSEEPVLTIGIIADNSARFLKTTLSSVLTQRSEFPVEIVIVDNASIDQTRDCIKFFLQNQNAVATVHYLKEKTCYEEIVKYIVENSKGEYILCLDGNDHLPGKTVCGDYIRFLNNNPSYSAVCGRVQFVDVNGQQIKGNPLGERYYSGTDYTIRSLLNWQSPAFLNAVMIRRSAINNEKEHFAALSKLDIPFDKRVFFHLLRYGNIKILSQSAYRHRCLNRESYNVFSMGSKPYIYVNRAIHLLEKASKDIYNNPLNFNQAKVLLWTSLCVQYYKTHNSLLKKDIKEVYRTAKDKDLYSYWREKIRIRYEKNNEYLKDTYSNEPVSNKSVTYNFTDYNAVAKTTKKRNGRNDRKGRPMVSIGMTVYNQENYVGKAIESILAQKVNFTYEIVIAEDCSTDRTREIVKEYARRYPTKIRLILQEKNVGLKAQSAMLRRVCNGVYRTHLEGDDYWLTTDKLQKQVDFLEKNRDYIAVTGLIKIVDEEGVDCDFPYGDIRTIYSFDKEYTLQHFERWLLPSHTGALLYRNVFYDMDEKEREIYETADIAGDRKTALYLAMQGRIYCMPEYISVRRIELNSPTNFTAVNRKAHPYTMIYRWMCDLEKLAYRLKGVSINLFIPKEQQWIYALHYLMKSPSRQALGHVRKIFRMSDHKKLYLKVLQVKMKDKFRKAVRDIGFFRTCIKWSYYSLRGMVRIILNQGSNAQEMHETVLSGRANHKK